MATPQPEIRLDGHRVLVCRPQPQADIVCEHLQALGAEARALPMITINPLPLSGEGRTRLLNLDNYSHVICISPAAAGCLIEQMDNYWPQWPVGIQWWGLGRGTARELEQAGIHCNSPDAGHDTEALLAEPALSSDALEHSRVLIAKGQGGRPLLPDTLAQRGARVESLVLYERQRPSYSPEILQATFADFNPDTVITLSGETLNNLMRVVQNTGHSLSHRHLIVPVPRVADQARAAGFTSVQVPVNLSPEALAAAVAGNQPLPRSPEQG